MYPTLSLKPGKEKTVKFHHPWIFSGALKSLPKELRHGEIVHVADSHGEILATGSYSAHSTIAVRVFDFQKTVINTTWLKKAIAKAEKKRGLLGYGPNTDTTAYRIVFGEADGIPGLVVDRYQSILVIQLSTAGIESLKTPIFEALIELFRPSSIIERSDLNVREEELLKEQTGIIYGPRVPIIEFQENGTPFMANLFAGQKTGFFLDQKDLRKEIRNLAKDRSVLNLFSYSGAHSIAAVKGEAEKVHNIDSSKIALEWCEQNRKLNKIPAAQFTMESAEIFKWFGRQKSQVYDMVILDPPALIKSHKHQKEGQKAYHFLNREALKILKKDGILITSSCSHFFSEEDFTLTLRRASAQAETELNLLKVVRQSPDHPISLYFPESYYLKTFIGVKN